MAKPRLIILVRHAQSEGNKNREIHQTIPDHRVKLTALGRQQALDAGKRLRDLLRPSDTLHFFTSPYRRTRETTEGILQSLTAPEDDGCPSPFAREDIKVYEEPRLREQDFGNFQPCSAEMERMWQERADYGHFFYRIPDGESAADAYDRVSGFNESLWRQFGEDDFASVCVLVTHGLMSRVFLMKWYHFTVEYFEDLRNVNHCEFLIMRKQPDTGKYLLENKLRTWSELRLDRAAREKERDGKEKEKDFTKLERSKTFVVTRRWGGCPNGCNHGRHYKRRDDLEILRQQDETTAAGPHAHHGNGNGNGHDSGCGGGDENDNNNNDNNNDDGNSAATGGTGTNGAGLQSSSSGIGISIATRRQQLRQISYTTDADDMATPTEEPRIVATSPGGTNGRDGPQIDVLLATEEVVSSPDGTPSFISPENRVLNLKSPQFFHTGRDFGGSYSGVPSLANSDAEMSDDDAAMRARKTATTDLASRRLAPVGNGQKTLRIDSLDTTLHDAQNYHPREGMEWGAKANRLGDAPQAGDDAASDGGGDADADGEGDGEGEVEADDELAAAEREDRSILGSVY